MQSNLENKHKGSRGIFELHRGSLSIDFMVEASQPIYMILDAMLTEMQMFTHIDKGMSYFLHHVSHIINLSI